ncbi:60S acidic ribosomal protein P1 [Plecturocebus cupreus]
MLSSGPHCIQYQHCSQQPRLALGHTSDSVLELACIDSDLVLHNAEAIITEDKVNILTEAAGVNDDGFWPGLSSKALAIVKIRSFHCSGGAGQEDLLQQLMVHLQEVLPLHHCCPGQGEESGSKERRI